MMRTNNEAKNQFILWILGTLSLFYCLLMILPWSPKGNGFYLIDQSWASALHLAFAEGMQFGRDFIYTYGLYGFIQVDSYFPDTYVYFFGLRLFTALVVWFGLFRIICHCLARRDLSILFLIPVFGFFPHSVIWMNNFQFTVIFLPLILYFYVSYRVTPVLVLTTFAMALSSLVKHTYLLPSIVFVILITIDELHRQRRFPRILSLYSIAMIFFWIGGGQNIANFPAYIINGFEMVKGYSTSMGIAGPIDEIIFYVFSTGLFWLLITATEWKYRRTQGLLPALGLAAMLFITFKSSFARHDFHAVQTTLNTTPIVALFVAMLWPKIRSYSWQLGKKIKVTATLWCGISLLLLFLMGSTILHNYLDYGYGTYSLNLFQQTTVKLSEARALITGKANLQQYSETYNQSIRARNPLPNISGTVDLYPNEVGVIFANGWDYQPRPILQSFSAYTDKLAQLNLDHLRKNTAAKNILFDIKPIDGHLPSVEDGLSWPELLTHYDIKDIEGRYLVLERNLQPRPYSLQPLVKTTIALGEWFELPQKAFFPIWAKINLDPNIFGRLSSLALRLPPMYMEIETADNRQHKYRLITDVMDQGFLISPILSNRWDFLALADSDWQRNLKWSQVKRIRISNQGLNSLLYPNSYEISLSSLEFPRQDFSQVTGWQNWHRNMLSTGTAILPIDGALEKIELPNNKYGFFAHAPMKIKVKLADTSERLSFGFGILDGAWQEGATDGVEFRVVAHELNGQEKVIFSRRLEPVSQPNDRGVQQATIDLSQIDAYEVILETLEEENNSWDWSFWSEITTK